ncbi:MAG: hypothetical protein Tsb0013_23920 [Phycisphaerales bacterium]
MPRIATLAPACTALLAISTLTLLPACQTTDPDAFIEAQEFPRAVQSIADRAKDQGKPALVVVDADWCTYCKRYNASTLTDASTERYLDEHTVFAHVDYDQNKDALRAVGVTALPTTMLFVDGAPRASFTGPKSSDELIAWIEQHAG